MASHHDILDRKPQLIEHFISLEGEGITVGRAALFIRTNQCNLSCNFCDTAFSITGKHPTLVDDMTSVAYTNYLKGKYNLFDRDNVTNLSITGGEPLLNLNYFGAMIDATVEAFPKINKVVIETNGFLLKDGILTVEDQIWGLEPFRKILKRDKSRNQDLALKEMLFIYYYCDIKSDYLIISDLKERYNELKHDIDLPENWKIDNIIQEAIDFYEKRSLTVIGKLYKDALTSIHEMSEYLKNTGTLLRERNKNDGVVATLPMIISAQEKLPKIMQNLKAAEKEVLKERIELEGKMKGKQAMGLFEGGLSFD